MKPYLLFWVTLSILPSLLFNSFAEAARETKPFWAEKSAFIEGDDLFVVGVASKARTVEEGRKQAFEHGKLELMNYAQVTSLEAQGLVIETQMAYEEPNPDGSVNVFRLLRVPFFKVIAIQGRLQTQGRVQEQALEQTRRELAAVQDSLTRKQQDLESRARTIEGTLQAVSQLQVMLGEKVQKIEQQQRQVEQLLQQLNMKLQMPRAQVKQSHTSDSLVDTLKQAEAQLDERERELALLHQRTVERIKAQSQKACKYVASGMTQSDVRQLLGEPNGRAYPFLKNDVWSYGKTQVHFNSQGIVGKVSGCSR